MRAFRLLRLFRLLKLARYTAAMKRLQQAYALAREGLILFGVTALVFPCLSPVGIYYFEKDAKPEEFNSVFHSLWWAVTTLTTIGYGDIYPITAGGRILTFFILVIGLGLVAIPTGLFTSALSRTRKYDDEPKK